MNKVKKINIFAYAKVQAVILAFAGIVAGVLYSGIGLIYDISTNAVSYGTALAFIAIPTMPLCFACFGFVTGVIGAFLYNKATKKFGGIKMDIVAQ